MGATVIDSLVVALGLDSKQFNKGREAVDKDLDKTKDKAVKNAKEIEQAGKQAAQFYSRMRNEAMAFFAAVAVGSGIKSFISDTIEAGAATLRTAENLKMATTRLNAYQQASEYFGGTQAGIVAQLKQSADDVSRFKMGLTSESLSWFFRMGGQTSDLQDGNRYLLARADIIKKIFDVDPNKARLIAQSMGISDEQFSFVRQGSAGITALVNQREKLAKFTQSDAEEMNKLRVSWLDFTNSVQYSSTKILIALEPLIKMGLAKLQEWADWLVQHQDQVVGFFNHVVGVIVDVAKKIDDAVESLGGWKNVLIALIALKVVSFTSNLIGMASALGSVATQLGAIGAVGGLALRILGPLALLFHSGDLNTDEAKHLALNAANPLPDIQGKKGAISLDDRKKYLLGRLRQDGYTDAQAAGIMGSLMQESGLDPNARNTKTGAYGIGQWLSKDRRDAFKGMYEKDITQSTFTEQVEFMVRELNTSEKRAGGLLRRATDATMAAKMHAWEYERPGADEANIDRRVAYANDFLASMSASGTGTAGAATPSALAGGGAGSNVSSETNIDTITIHTNATDAGGIAQGIGGAIQRFNSASQLNTGVH